MSQSDGEDNESSEGGGSPATADELLVPAEGGGRVSSPMHPNVTRRSPFAGNATDDSGDEIAALAEVGNADSLVVSLPPPPPTVTVQLMGPSSLEAARLASMLPAHPSRGRARPHAQLHAPPPQAPSVAGAKRKSLGGFFGAEPKGAAAGQQPAGQQGAAKRPCSAPLVAAATI